MKKVVEVVAWFFYGVVLLLVAGCGCSQDTPTLPEDKQEQYL